MVVRPFLLASQHLNSNEKITGYLDTHILLSVLEEKMLLSHHKLSILRFSICSCTIPSFIDDPSPVTKSIPPTVGFQP